MCVFVEIFVLLITHWTVNVISSPLHTTIFPTKAATPTKVSVEAMKVELIEVTSAIIEADSIVQIYLIPIGLHEVRLNEYRALFPLLISQLT